MKLSYDWLKEYLKCELTPQQVADAMTAIGIEVDGVEEQEQIPGGLAGVVVARVLTCEAHPDSDHLHITTVDAGSGEPLTVVCGAPNVAAGQKVLFAQIGTVLPGDFKIKKSKIRGVESFGMICAEDELGIGDSHEGIMVLPEDAVVGTPAKEYLHLETEAVIEYEITANRIDAASHWGVARDLYAWLRLNHLPCELVKPSVDDFREGEGAGIPVEVRDSDGAPRYTGITLRGVKVAPSPEWLQRRLTSIGLRPINNVVDVSNFVLFELGQPLHTFDAGKIGGGRVVVRRAAEGEPIRTLDGAERKLCSRDMVIADEKVPMCIAGVFGGEDSGVTDATTDVFVESAYFDPASIRKTSKKEVLQTDASFRFERGCDPEITVYALKRAVTLILATAGGRVEGGIVDIYPKAYERRQIELDYDRIERFSGQAIGHDKIETILTALNYEFLEKRPGGALVAAPSYMVDVYRECDVVEEILRVYGYNNIELPHHMKMSVSSTPKPDPEAIRNAISNFLAANGFVEIMNNSLTKADYYAQLTSFPAERLVKIVNPLSQDLGVMRQSLIPGGLEVVAYNLNRQMSSLRTFEYGSVYSRLPDKPGETLEGYEEHTCFTLMLTGTPDKSWRQEAPKSDYFQLKGYLELLLRRYGADINQLWTEPAPADVFAEGMSYRLPGTERRLAMMGRVNPALTRKFGVKQAVYAAEIDWPALLDVVKRDKIGFSELPKFPAVRRDLALLLDEKVSYADLRAAAFKQARKLLRQVGLFDVYRGDKIPAGKKQYALSFVIQDQEKTLTDQDTERVMERLLTTFQKDFGAQLR
ncbi:MAG: phenylalanine--tRNA ligase subunit beta [Bacteroidales bacterium]|jgi:phenylalanyl-tRNA synthetase beta chain|nr:phenylalanine--tRNA ligase subunit beta [Bacteroidales bacterium]